MKKKILWGPRAQEKKMNVKILKSIKEHQNEAQKQKFKICIVVGVKTLRKEL